MKHIVCYTGKLLVEAPTKEDAKRLSETHLFVSTGEYTTADDTGYVKELGFYVHSINEAHTWHNTN